MKLTTYFPKHNQFNRTKFYANGEFKRLTLRVVHSVVGTVGGLERIGNANIDYNIDFPKKAKFTNRLTVDGSLYVGVQSTDLVNQAVQELRPRTAYSFSKVLNTKFDMRALCYVLGAATAIGVGGADFDVPAQVAGYKTLGTGWSVPDAGDAIFGPNVASTPNEFVTLLALAGEAGVRTCTVLSDDILGTGGRMLIGRRLASYARRLAANVLSAAHETLSYGAHRKAFECGKTVGMTLNAHTDEGGWLRRLMTDCTYPRSVGIVFGMGTSFDGVPLQENVPVEEITRLVIGEYLEFVALFPVADHNLHGTQTLIAKEIGEDNRPGSFDLLPKQIYAVMDEVRNLLCDAGGFHHDANKDGGAHVGYVTRNSIDAHFDVETLMPWWLVEPAPLLVREHIGYDVPARQGGIVELPLFDAANVSYDSPYLDRGGRVAVNSNIWVERNPTSFRKEGASYLLSARYSPLNGLSQLRVEAEDLDGHHNGQLMFIDNTAPSVADARWVTPHNPLPSPMEGYSVAQTTLRYRSVSLAESLTPEEAMSGKVESRLSTFTVVDESSGDSCISHRDIPPSIRRKLRVTNTSASVLTSLTIKSLRPRVTPTVEESTDKTEDAADVAGNDKDVGVTEDSGPVDDLAEDGPLVAAQAADSGVRPALPTVKTPGLGKDDKSNNGD